MINSHLTRDSFPLEILYKILQLLEPSDLYNFTLVCKALKNTTQSVLYSKVCIDTALQFKAFYYTVEQYPHLANQVKSLLVKNFLTNDLQDMLSNLLSTHLPNLEEFDNQFLNSYTLVKNALTNSKLKHLKRLGEPFLPIGRQLLIDYTSCVLMLKERLENILITDNLNISNEQSIYENLHQFVNLSDIHLNYKTKDMIEVLEHVTESCKSLKSVKFEIPPPSSNRRNSPPVPAQAVSKYTPNTNIKSLNGRINVQSDYRLIKYIFLKFPQLQQLFLNMNIGNQASLDEDILGLLLRKMSTMNKFSLIDAQIEILNIIELFLEHWYETSEEGQESVAFIYTNDSSQHERFHQLMDIVKEDGSKRVHTAFKFLSSAIDEDEDFFTSDNGVYIGKLKYDFINKAPHTPSHLKIRGVTHTLRNCPNVQQLHFNQCILKRDANANIDLSNSFSMKELYFSNCILFPGMLEQLSLIMPQIETLRLRRTSSRPREHDSPNTTYLPIDESLELFMPHTAVNRIIFEIDHDHEEIHIKLFDLTSRRYNYYQVEADSFDLVDSNDYEYADDDNYTKRINICCLKKPTIQFKYNDDAKLE